MRSAKRHCEGEHSLQRGRGGSHYGPAKTIRRAHIRQATAALVATAACAALVLAGTPVAPAANTSDSAETPSPVVVHKTIDSLGDGGNNTQTELRGEDFYRLNLDIVGKSSYYPKPSKKQNVDVVFCLDFSASMDETMDGYYWGYVQEKFSEDPVQEQWIDINGNPAPNQDQADKRHQDMATIMASDTVTSILDDPGNKVSVVGFYGNSAQWTFDSRFNMYLRLSDAATPHNPNLDFSDGQSLVDWTSSKADLSSIGTTIESDFTTFNDQDKFYKVKEIDDGNKDVYVMRPKRMQGTNYTAGFREVLSKLDEVKDDGNRKILVFLSDGVPTCYFPSMYVTADQDGTTKSIVHGRWGNGGNYNNTPQSSVSYEPYPYSMTTSKDGTLNVWNGSKADTLRGLTDAASQATITTIYDEGNGQVQQKLAEMGVNLTTYTIGVSTELSSNKGDTDADYDTDSSYVLKEMASTEGAYNTPGKYYSAQDASHLRAAIEEIVNDTSGGSAGNEGVAESITNASITDELSSYVQYYQRQPDVRVTMEQILDDQGNEIANPQPITIWEGSKATAQGTFTDAAGQKKPIIQTVEVPAASSASESASSTGTVRAVFDPSFNLDKKYRYTLSFNVQATNKAYTQFAESGYNATGDAATDDLSAGNATSSDMPGFYSNEIAQVSYTADGTDGSVAYDKPVIQVGETQLSITKEWKDAEGNPLADSEHPGTVTAHLYADGEDTGRSVELSASNGWKGTFDKLVPKKLADDGTYAPIQYTIVEDTVSGFTPHVQYGTDANATSFSDGSANRIDVDEAGKTVTHVYTGGSATGQNGQATLTNSSRLFALQVTKTDADSGAALGGARFALHRDVDDDSSYDPAVDQSATDAEAQVDEQGVVRFTGLSLGTYWLEETYVPAGYQMAARPYRVVFSDGAPAVQVADDSGAYGRPADLNPVPGEEDVYALSFTDQKAALDLPSLGILGGSAVLYLLGAACVVCAVALLWRRRA